MRRFWNHFLFWALYLAFEIYTEFEWIQGQYHFSPAKAMAAAMMSETALVVLVKIPMVYAIFAMLGRLASHKFKLIVSISAILLVFSLLSRTLTVAFCYPFAYGMDVPVFAEYQGLINSFMDAIFIAGVAIALKQHSNNTRLVQREKQLMKEKLETELNFLKAQINPHFLFNTLNSIYALALKKSEDTPDVVVKLSKLLRFVLYEAQAKTITVEKEILFLNDYIALEKIRYNQRLELIFHHTADDLSAPIVPLLLVPFVENAFKHGASETTQKAHIRIQLELQQGRLSFVVENSFEHEPDLAHEGIGLKNLRRQLELLYPGFALATEVSGKNFKASLVLNLNFQS